MMDDTFTSVYRPASRLWNGPGPGFCPPWRPDAPFPIPPEPRHYDRQFGMGPPNCYHSRRSTSPLAERCMSMEREGQLFAPKQQLQQPRPVRDQQRQMKEDLLAGQAITVKQQELSEAAVPKDLRLPQPPNRRTVPDWVEDCFEKDEYALLTEEQCNIPFLREGVVPKVGMMLYLQMTYKHDGSHPQHYRTWGRMVGEITHVYDPPEVGVYAVYDGQEARLSPQELQEQRNNLPALPPSLFGQNATCECCRTAEQVVEQYGAVHGQRVKGKMWLLKCDSGLEPQLGGFWDIELVANDNLDSMWVLCAMSRQDNEQPQEQLPRQRQHQEQQQAKQAQQHQSKQPQQQVQHQEQQKIKHAQQQQHAQQQAQQQVQQSPQSRDTRGDESAQDQQHRPQSAQPAPQRAQVEQQEEGQVQGNEPPAGRSAQQQQQQQPVLSYRRQQPQKQQQGEPCPYSARQAERIAHQQQQQLQSVGSDRQYDRAAQQEQHVRPVKQYDRGHSATRQQQQQGGRKQHDWGHKQQGYYNQQQQQQQSNRDHGREQQVFDQRRDNAREQQREYHDREQRREHTNPEQQRQGHGREQQTYKRQQQHDPDSQQQHDRGPEQQRGYKRERDGAHVNDRGYQDSDCNWYGREQNRGWNHKQDGDWDNRERKRSTSSGSGRNSY